MPAPVSEPLNAACFDEPHWLVIARGFATESWFEDGQAVGTGGILMPKPEKLRPGQRYYRFASTTSSRAAQLGGGWWIDAENFRRINTFARDHGYALSQAARLFLALPYAWTRVDRLISALLETPMKAYAGRGKPAESGKSDQRDRNSSWIPMQHGEVRQLYIPGLYRPGLGPDDPEQPFRLAFPSPRIEFIHGNRRPI